MFYVEHGADELTPHLLAELAGDLWAAGAFDRRLAGRELAFVWDGEGFVDLQTKSRWDLQGRAHAGPLAGRRLTPLIHDNTLWFAWAAFFRDTRVYGVGP